jgi:hypothetical protein
MIGVVGSAAMVAMGCDAKTEGAAGVSGISGIDAPAAATASVMAAWASAASGTDGGGGVAKGWFSVWHCSQTQTVRPSFVVTAWQFVQVNLFLEGRSIELTAFLDVHIL